MSSVPASQRSSHLCTVSSQLADVLPALRPGPDAARFFRQVLDLEVRFLGNGGISINFMLFMECLGEVLGCKL